MSEKNRQVEYDEENFFSILTVLKLALNKFNLIIISGLITALAVCLFVLFFVSPTYECRTTFYVYNTSDSSSINNSDVQAAKNLAVTYAKILKNNAVLDAVIKDINDTHGYTRKELRDTIIVSTVTDSQLIEIAVQTNNPDLSYEIANSVVKNAPKEILRIAKVGSVEAVNQPEFSDKKTSPKTFYDMLIGFIAGMIISFGILCLKFFSDATIYSTEDVERLVGEPVLGQIPEIKNVQKNKMWTLKKAGVISYEDKNEKSESFSE